ncbi:MAG: hypothetical protein KDK64_02420 [Chlamydiia bacterium]|nr:hypothetical protein [Chlamydiia bacterium]
MLNGLLRIWQRSFPAPTEPEAHPSGSLEEFRAKGAALAQEGKLFDSLMRLATNPKWNFIVKHLDDIYLAVAPRDFKNFVHALTNFLVKLANNELQKEDIQEVVHQLITLKENLQESDALAFFFHEFPEVMDVIELLNKDPHYARVIAPLLFGNNSVTHLISKHGYPSFEQFRAHPEGSDRFVDWVERGHEVTVAPPSKTREPLPVNAARIDAGVAAVERINEELVKRGERRKITLVVQYNMDKTSPAYVERALANKMKDVKDHLGHCKNIDWEFLVVDARQERTSGIESTFADILARETEGNVSGRQITLEGGGGKAAAVRCGMSVAADAGSDFVGFIDFSDKIHILEMTHLFTQAFQTEEEGGLAIGSRRLEASAVENKPLPFLIRSMGLNLVVKAMFPHLFNISDTQTGFKLFNAKSWQQIAQTGLQNDSLAFDIEILQQAARLGFPIAECAVDFHDSSQNAEDFGEDMVGSLFDEVVQIRATTKDTPLSPQKPQEARLIGGGAENVVYRLANGSIIKIPHEAADPDFVGFLKHVLFKGQKEMKLDDQKDKLITSQFINRLLTSPRFSKYIPALRSWADLNIFVMKMITSFENKAYKSMGYETAERYGRDLVIPFRFVEGSFSVEVDGEPKTFTREDNVKQSVFANAVFKDRVVAAIESRDPDAIIRQIDEGLNLFEDLWKRGLFDLDTNFLCDTGYYPDSEGRERLMVLDPGELIDDLSRIDINTARNQIEKRYDYIELEILLRSLPPEQKERVLSYYKTKMHAFFDAIEEGGSKRDQFGIDRREGGDFHVQFDERLELPWVETPQQTESQSKREAFRRSAVGYQHAFQTGMPALSRGSSSFPYTHVVPEGKEESGELGVGMGSIGPLAPALEQTLEHPQTDLFILDAGSATRASILKYGERSGTKGSVEVGGRPLYQHTAQNLQEFARTRLPEGYVILASGDDFLEISPEQGERMQRYLESGVGAYWCDLPDGGKTVIPLTRGLTVDFFRRHASLPELSHNFLRSVPVTKGFVDHMGTQTLFEGIAQAIPESEAASSSQGGGTTSGTLPGVSVLTDTYAQFLQFNAAQKLGGMKTPFLMILKKEFVEDFMREIVPLLPNYTWNDITWENILVRAMKADKEMWMMSGKPPLLDKATWGEIYDRIQGLKQKHGIDTYSPEQNEARVFRGNWQNFDDPYALFRFAAASFSPGETFHSDTPQEPPHIESPIPTHMAAIKSELEGTIQVIPPDGILRGVVSENLFYNVQIPRGQTLHVHAGHLVVQIDGELYSIAMGPMTKDDLKKSMVYKYEGGHPKPHMTYSQFAATRR